MTPANLDWFWNGFEEIADAPNGVARLRELILSLAVQGRLSVQEEEDEPASGLLKRIEAEKARLIQDGKIRKSAPLAPLDLDSVPFELPLGWAWARFPELGDWASGSGFPTTEQGHTDKPILFCKVSDMNLTGNERFIKSTIHTIDNDTARRIRAVVNPPGTVIFPKIGGAIATNKRRILLRPSAIDNNCLGIIPNIACQVEWLHLILSAIDFTKYQVGTSVPALNQGTLELIITGLPPLAEQKRIVAKVDELMALCDELEAGLKARHLDGAALVNAAVRAVSNGREQAKETGGKPCIGSDSPKLHLAEAALTATR